MGKKRILYVVLAVSLILNCTFLFAGCIGSWDLSTFFEKDSKGSAQDSVTDQSGASEGPMLPAIWRKLKKSSD